MDYLITLASEAKYWTLTSVCFIQFTFLLLSLLLFLTCYFLVVLLVRINCRYHRSSCHGVISAAHLARVSKIRAHCWREPWALTTAGTSRACSKLLFIRLLFWIRQTDVSRVTIAHQPRTAGSLWVTANSRGGVGKQRWLICDNPLPPEVTDPVCENLPPYFLPA